MTYPVGQYEFEEWSEVPPTSDVVDQLSDQVQAASDAAKDIFDWRWDIDIDVSPDSMRMVKRDAVYAAVALEDAVYTDRVGGTRFLVDFGAAIGQEEDAREAFGENELSMEALAWAAYANWVTARDHEEDEVDLSSEEFLYIHDYLSEAADRGEEILDERGLL